MTMHRRWGVTTAMILAVFLGACGKSGEDAAPATKPKVEVYEMRGEVRKLPMADRPRTLTIRHEVTKEMGAMTMEFTAAEGVSLAGLAVGDKVAFRYEVDLAARTERVTKIEKLPPDTVLNFGAMSMPGTMSMPGM